MILGYFVLLFAVHSCLAVSLSRVSRIVRITNEFETLIVSSPLDLVITFGETKSEASLTCTSSELLQSLSVEYSSGTLSLSSALKTNGVSVFLNLPNDLQALSLKLVSSGSVQMVAPKALKDLTVEASGGSIVVVSGIATESVTSKADGNGRISLSGSTQDSFMSIKGVGIIDAVDMHAFHTEFEVGGTGEISVDTTELEGSTEGSLILRYREKPMMVKLTNGGAVQMDGVKPKREFLLPSQRLPKLSV